MRSRLFVIDFFKSLYIRADSYLRAIMARQVQDLSNDDPPFNPNLWIARERKFPSKDKNFEVHAALEETLKVPSTHSSLIPGPNLPISDFLELSFPKTSSVLVFSTPDAWFTKDAPTTSVHCLLGRPIPLLEFLKALSKIVGQA
jgi:hypothetical protein